MYRMAFRIVSFLPITIIGAFGMGFLIMDVAEWATSNVLESFNITSISARLTISCAISLILIAVVFTGPVYSICTGFRDRMQDILATPLRRFLFILTVAIMSVHMIIRNRSVKYMSLGVSAARLGRRFPPIG